MDQNKLNRAAQFMPFEALNGLREELHKREEEHAKIRKRELDEEDKTAISNILAKIQKGDIVSLQFYFNGRYLNTVGKINEIEHLKNYLIVEDIQVNFDDIYEIKFYEDDGLKTKYFKNS